MSKKSFCIIIMLAIVLVIPAVATASPTSVNASSSISPEAATILAKEKTWINATSERQSFTIPSEEQQRAVAEKLVLANQYHNAKYGSISDTATVPTTIPILRGTPGPLGILNNCGFVRQSDNYTCGPMSASNLIQGYKIVHGLTDIPPIDELKTALNFSNNQTGFDATYWQNTLNYYAPGNNYGLQWGYTDVSAWQNDFRNSIEFTIDKTDNYNVIVDLYHTADTTPINTFYNGMTVQHYVVTYGYKSSTDEAWISDSNNNNSCPTFYKTYFNTAAGACRMRGIVW